jgi:hypothetical protein
MNAVLETLEPFTPAEPISHILANYFNKFVRYWSRNAEVRYLGEAQDVTVEMPIERCVRWEGNAQGTLVVRCYDDFLKWLRETKGYKPLSFGTGKEILDELAGLYGTYLIHNFWKADLLKIKSLNIQSTSPEKWPDNEPDAAFCLLVEGHPVEIRFWMGNTN